MERTRSVFLTARWVHLAMLNFAIHRDVLQPYVPAGTELDTWQGQSLVSVVGFLFRDTKVWGMSIPFHRNFEEVNLRFYVRRKTDEGWRRAVVFIKELAPRWAITCTARACYGENYHTARMGHRIETTNGDPRSVDGMVYWWRYRGGEHRVEISPIGDSHLPNSGSQEEFISEHYWAYTGGAGRPTIEYRVDHPRWNIRKAETARLTCDVASVYGSHFVEPLSAPPTSAFLADGSAVAVFKGSRLKA